MDSNFLLIFLLVAVIVSRIISEQALRILTAEQKAQLLDEFSNHRAYSLTPVLMIIGGYYAFIMYSDFKLHYINVGYIISILLFGIGNFLYVQNKLNKVDLPRSYKKRFGLSRVVLYISVFSVMLVILGNVL